MALSRGETRTPVTAIVQNVTPRVDINGRPIDCHDGCLRYFHGRFYWYGTAYGETDGFTPANVYTCYSSPDLTNWRPHGPLIPQRPEGVFYRPYVVFNPTTQKFVLWFNWYPKLWEGQLGAAVADRPEGPFQIVAPRVELTRRTPGDHNVFVDDDGCAYLVYTDIRGDGVDRHAIAVERLDASFTASAGQVSETLDRRVEAPAMFKRDSLYYVIFGETCCFCAEGADARVFVAERPLGPYRRLGNFNRDSTGKIIIPGQQTDICKLPTPTGTALLWMADLWGSRPDHVKGHDLQYWSEPLSFNLDGSIAPLRRVDSFSISLAP